MEFEKIKEIVLENFDVEEEQITLETSFEDLDVDSIDLYQVISEVEEEYDVTIDDFENIKTIGDIVVFIQDNK